MQHLGAIDQSAGSPQSPPHVPIEDLPRRARAINWTLKDVARKAGVAPSTAYEGAAGRREPLRRTELKLAAALVAREREILAHLLALHGRDAA